MTITSDCFLWVDMLSHCIPSSRVEDILSDDESAQESSVCMDFVNKQQQEHTCKSAKLEHNFDLLHFGQSETEKMIWATRQDTNKKIIQNDLAKSNIGLIESKTKISFTVLCVLRVVWAWIAHVHPSNPAAFVKLLESDCSAVHFICHNQFHVWQRISSSKSHWFLLAQAFHYCCCCIWRLVFAFCTKTTQLWHCCFNLMRQWKWNAFWHL